MSKAETLARMLERESSGLGVTESTAKQAAHLIRFLLEQNQELHKEAALYRYLRDAGQKKVEVFLSSETLATGWATWHAFDDMDDAIKKHMEQAK